MPRISTNTSGKSLALGTWLAGSTSWFAAVVLGWNFFLNGKQEMSILLNRGIGCRLEERTLNSTEEVGRGCPGMALKRML